MPSRLPKSLRTEVRVPPILWRLLWLAAAFWVGGSLPMWDDWYRNGDHTTFEWGTLWSLVAHLPETGLGDFWHRHEGNIGRLIPVLAVAAGPLVYYLIHRPRVKLVEAADYADGPGGAVADGRNNTPRLNWTRFG